MKKHLLVVCVVVLTLISIYGCAGMDHRNACEEVRTRYGVFDCR